MINLEDYLIDDEDIISEEEDASAIAQANTEKRARQRYYAAHRTEIADKQQRRREKIKMQENH